MPSVSSIETTRTRLTCFLELLHNQGVDICVLRNYDDIIDGSARDIDCIPALGQWGALEEAICAFAKTTGACLIVFRRQYVHSFHVMFRDGVLLTIDIILEIQGWWGAAYLYNDKIWTGASKRGDFWIPRPAHEAAMAFFQHLLWGGFYKRKYAGRLPLLIAQDEQEFRRIITEHFGQRWLCLIDWIKQKNVARIEKNVSGLRKSLWANALKRDCQKTLSRFLLFVVQEGAITLRKRGLFIALIGPDGVGKTTLAGALKADWGCLFRDVLYFHFRPPLVHGLHADIPRGGDVQFRNLSLRPTFVDRVLSPARLLISVIRFNLGYWLRVFPALLHQNLVIADRYFYSYLLFPESVRYYGPRWLVRCLARLFPKPDLVLALYAPPDVIRTRKSELSEWELTKQLGDLSSVCSIADTQLLDADRSLEEIVQASKAHITESVSRRGGKDVAGWEADVKTTRLPRSILSRDSGQTSSTYTRYQQQKLNDDAVHVDEDRWISFSTPSGAQYAIPASPRKVAAASLEFYRPQKLLARAGKRLLSTALSFGLAQPLLRHRANAHGIAKGHREWWEDDGLPGQLRKIFGVNKVSASFLVACPNEQKIVAQVMDDEANILGYLKMGCSPETIDAIHREERALRRLQTHFFSTATIPKIIYAGYWNNCYLLIQGPPTIRTDTSPGRITDQHIAFLSELYAVAPQTQLAGSDFMCRIRRRVEQLTRLGYGSVLPVLNVLEEFHSGVGETNVICGFMHGDFAPWNILGAQNGLFVFDWENSHTIGTPGWDLFHFIVQTGILVRHLSAREIYESIFGNGATHKCVDAYFREVGTPPHLIRLCLRLYIADVMSFHFCSSGGSGGSKGERQRSTWRDLLALASVAEGGLEWSRV
jgi:thymidylate kinase